MESITLKLRAKLWLAVLALFAFVAAVPAPHVVKLTGEDFGHSADAQTLTLKAGKNQVLRITHIYAESIVLMPADSNTTYSRRWAASREGIQGSRSEYVFTLDISHLPAGAYVLSSKASNYKGWLNIELK